MTSMRWFLGLFLGALAGGFFALCEFLVIEGFHLQPLVFGPHNDPVEVMVSILPVVVGVAVWFLVAWRLRPGASAGATGAAPRPATLNAEEDRRIGSLLAGLDRMETRVQNLETILMARRRTHPLEDEFERLKGASR